MRTIEYAEWRNHQGFERNFWGDCVNTYDEETKQMAYAELMGLSQDTGAFGRWPCYNLKNKVVMDIGGGPCSLLLKCENLGDVCTVVDPCDYPFWVHRRYQVKGIHLWVITGESVHEKKRFDEVWIYNCLQHVIDPKKIVENAMNCLKPNGVLRMFEWVNIPISEGHPHMLTPEELGQWVGLGSDFSRNTQYVNKHGATGNAFFGTFPKKG